MANINIYGKLYNNTVDKVIAGAEQIYDETQGKMQDIINAELYAASGDITDKIGQANGIAGLDSDGKVPSSQLPSYVDDVLEYDNQAAFPASGESGKIYVAKDTNLTYRWSGSAYVEISQSLALGETSSTAYPGDKGKAVTDKVAEIEPDFNKLLEIASESGISLGCSSSDFIVDGSGDAVVLTFPVTKFADDEWKEPYSHDVRFNVATRTENGMMSKADKAKLDDLNEDPIQSFTVKNTNNGESSRTYQLAINTDHVVDLTINAGSVMEAGLLSTDDKFKLDGIAENANLYILPTATASTLGGVKSSTTGTTAGKDYKVQVNSDGTMKVNVPWVDTKYTLPAATASTLGGIKVGAGLAVTAEGVLSATGGGEADSVAWANVSGKPSEFNPPLASATVRGGVKVGSGLTMSGEALGVDLTAQSPVVQKWQNDIENANTIVETNVGRKYLKLAGGTMTGNLNITSAKPVLTMTATGSANTIVLNPSDGDTETAKIALSSSDGSTEINLSTSEGTAKLTSNRLSFGDTDSIQSMLSDQSLQIGTNEGNNIEVTSTDITKNGQSIIPVALTTGEIEAICV